MRRIRSKKITEKMGKMNLRPSDDMTRDELKKAYEYQKNISWTFNHEFEKTDTTLHNRFNFLLLAYSLFINAYFMVENKIDKNTILIIGLIITFFLSVGLYKVYVRYNILLNILNNLDEKEVASIVMKKLNLKKIYKIFPSSVFINGIMIPVIMLLSFIIGIIFNVLYN